MSFDPLCAEYTELSDMVFTRTWANGGQLGFVPTPASPMVRPDYVIGFMATRISVFYDSHVRPYFSRHLAGLPPAPLAVGAPAAQMGQRAVEMYVKNRLMNRQNVNMFLHLCERASPDDIDSFINHVGIHAVLRVWSQNLQVAPNKLDRLLGQFKEAWTLYEYQHILSSLNADPDRQKLPPKVAESMYLLCYALEDPNVPVRDDDIEALRDSPKCSDYLAALRLDSAGAFEAEDA